MITTITETGVVLISNVLSWDTSWKSSSIIKNAIQWDPSKKDTIGTAQYICPYKRGVLISGGSFVH